MRTIVSVLAAFLFAACHPDIAAIPPTASALQVTSGDAQTGVPGFRLANPVAVTVVDEAGHPMAGITMVFTPDDQLAAAEPDTVVTDNTGTARTAWRIGAFLGTQHLRASALTGTDIASATFSATVTSNLVQAIGGGLSSLCAVDMNGGLGCWLAPQPGIADASAHFTPVAATVKFNGLAMYASPSYPSVGATTFSGASSSGCALATNGTVWCFTVDSLANINGLTQLTGNNPPPFVQIFSAESNSFPTGNFCGLTALGVAWCWGNFQQGAGVDTVFSSAAALLPNPVPTSTRFTQMDPGNVATCGVATDQTAWCWGINDFGQTGGLTGSIHQVSSLLTFTRVFVDQARMGTCGLSAAGAGLYCWGDVDALLGSGGSGFTLTPTTPPSVALAADAIEMPDAFVILYQDGSMAYQGDISSGLQRSPISRVLRNFQVHDAAYWICGEARVGTGTLCLPQAALFVNGPGSDYDFTGPIPHYMTVIGVPLP